MASEVDICNLSLSHLRVASIAALADTNVRAVACNRHYAVTRDAVLREHAWGFAKKRKVLILIDETFSGWDYAYLHPSDCMVAREVYDADGSLSGSIYDPETDTFYSAGKVEFEVSLGEDLSATDRVITDATQADPVVITAVAHGYLDLPEWHQ